MAQLFDVPIPTESGSEMYAINPLNVVLLRPVHMTQPEGAVWTEILFTNTMGQQSSVITTMPIEKVKMYINDALRGH